MKILNIVLCGCLLTSCKMEIFNSKRDKVVISDNSEVIEESSNSQPKEMNFNNNYRYRNTSKLPTAGISTGRLIDRVDSRAHPRLYLYNQDFEEIRAKIEDPFLAPVWNKLKASAEQLILKTNGNYNIPIMSNTAGSSLSRARTMRDRVLALSLAFKVFRNEEYRTRLWLELSQVCSQSLYPFWGTYHRGIDIGEMSYAVALAYDWLYADWGPGQKSAMQNALMRNTIIKARDYYDNNIWWSTPTKYSNWNFVANAGIISAALALGKEGGNDDLVQGVLVDSIASLRRGLDWFDINGGNPEGIGYWLYAVTYLSIAVEGFKTALGSDVGFLSHEGLRQAGRSYRGLISNTAFAFGYGDSGGNGSRSALLQWLGGEFDDEFLLDYANEPTNQTVESSFYYLMYFRGIPTSFNHSSIQSVTYYPHPRAAVLRNNWTDSRDLFLAFKGGDNQASHAHLDHGTFNFQADAVPWFEELGIGNYSLPGYFDSRSDPNSPAYDYYRLRAEGQNTVVFNPSEDGGQNIFAKSEFIGLNKNARHGVVNLTPAYNTYVGRFFRGFALIEDNKAAMIKDHISQAKLNLNYVWSAHTKITNARFLDESKQTIVLYENGNQGRRLLVHVKEPNLAFMPSNDGSPLHPAAPMTTSPRLYWDSAIDGVRQNQNQNFRKIMLSGTTNNFLVATVLMYPLAPNEAEVLPSITDARWNTPPADWPRGISNFPPAPGY